MHHLQSRRFSGDGPYARARIRTPPGPRKGALQSLQRGGDGSRPQIWRIRWSRGKVPVTILSHISSTVSLAMGETLHARARPAARRPFRTSRGRSRTRSGDRFLRGSAPQLQLLQGVRPEPGFAATPLCEASGRRLLRLIRRRHRLALGAALIRAERLIAFVRLRAGDGEAPLLRLSVLVLVHVVGVPLERHLGTRRAQMTAVSALLADLERRQ